MINIAVVKDPHIMLGIPKPLSRTDSFSSDMRTKFISLRDKCRALGVTHFVFTGDVFQVKAPSKYDINSISMYDELFLEIWGEFEIYTIRGNHDMFVTSQGEHSNSIFEMGLKHGWYKTLDESLDIEGKLAIYGLDFDSDVENLKEDIQKMSKIATNKSFLGYKTAIVLHEHLVPNTREMFLNSYILYDYFEETDFDIVIGGHLHKGYEPTTLTNGTIVINPWSLTRLARDHYVVDEKHKPSFTHVSISDDGTIETQTVNLKHRRFETAFTHTVVSEANLLGDISAFKAKIAEVGSLSEVNPDILRTLSAELDSDNPELVDKAITYIEELILGD